MIHVHSIMLTRAGLQCRGRESGSMCTEIYALENKMVDFRTLISGRSELLLDSFVAVRTCRAVKALGWLRAMISVNVALHIAGELETFSRAWRWRRRQYGCVVSDLRNNHNTITSAW